MDMNNIVVLAGLGIGTFLALLLAYYLLKILIPILLKTLYVLLLLAMVLLGTGWLLLPWLGGTIPPIAPPERAGMIFVSLILMLLGAGGLWSFFTKSSTSPEESQPIVANSDTSSSYPDSGGYPGGISPEDAYAWAKSLKEMEEAREREENMAAWHAYLWENGPKPDH